MVSGAGVGDVIQLAQISARLSATFSKGPSGAASEFLAVKEQLSSLSVILEALAVAVGKPQTDIQDVENVERFGEMLEGCRSTLNRIEYIVDKYSDRIGPGWKWKNWFSKGYKLIRWTADGGDIKSLKTELRRHHNLIDAYVNILQRADLQQALDVLEHMLGEYVPQRRNSGFKPVRPTKPNVHNNVVRVNQAQCTSTTGSKLFEGYPAFFAASGVDNRKPGKSKMNFSISRRGPMVSICREATINPDFFLNPSRLSEEPLFICLCRRGVRGVLGESHAGVVNQIRCGPSTIILKNESSDLIQREYTLYDPKILGFQEIDKPEDQPYVISIPLRKNQRAFEASLAQLLAHQAARNLAEGYIPESKWVRWENDSGPVGSESTIASPISPEAQIPVKDSRGRILVASSVRLGITAQVAAKTMNIKYIPPNNSNWPDRVQVDSLLVVQYRSIRKQRLYQPNDDTNPWQDGDALRLYIDFSKLSGRVVTQNSLRAEYIWDEKIRNSGAVVTLRVRDIKHYENDTLVEGTGTVTYLGDWVNLVSGYGPGIKLDKWNLPLIPEEEKYITNEAAFLVTCIQPLREQLGNFWATRASRKEEVRGSFNLSGITVGTSQSIFEDMKFSTCQLVILHDKSNRDRTTRIVVRSASGELIISQDVSRRESTSIDLKENSLFVDQPKPIISELVAGRDRDGPSLGIRREPRRMSYNFTKEEDAIACICLITELAREEKMVTETMALEDAISGPPVEVIVSPTTSYPEFNDLTMSATELPIGSKDNYPLIAELPATHIKKKAKGSSDELDVEIYDNEEHKTALCKHATINPALLVSFDGIGQADLPLFVCRCESWTGVAPMNGTHDLDGFRVGAFTLPVLALGGGNAKTPGSFVVVNATSSSHKQAGLFIICPDPRQETLLEGQLANLLRMRLAANAAIVGIRPSQDIISVYEENEDSFSILSAFSNTSATPSVSLRVDGTWKPLTSVAQAVAISQHQIVERYKLLDRLITDPNNHKDLFGNSGRSMLQLKADDSTFVCFVNAAPKFHNQRSYITLTMEVEEAVLAPEEGVGAVGENLGFGRLRLRFEGAGAQTQRVASELFGWLNFWRNRLRTERWFDVDDDEEVEYTTSIEEVDMDTKNPDYFDGYFNNGKLSLLRNTELGTVRILVQSFSSDRILSQDALPAHFNKGHSLSSSVMAMRTDDRMFSFPQQTVIADKTGHGEPRSWRLDVKTTYRFPTRQIRDAFCQNLARVLETIGGYVEPTAGTFELDSTPISPGKSFATELPAFDFSAQSILRRTNTNFNQLSDPEDVDDDSDTDTEFVKTPPRTPTPATPPHSPPPESPANRLGRLERIQPISFQDDRARQSMLAESNNGGLTPLLYIPPPPPLPSIPEEFRVAPLRIRKSPSIDPSQVSPGRTSTYTSPQVSPLPSPRQPMQRLPSISNGLVRYRVWAQYDAQSDGELSVQVGDILEVDHEDDNTDLVWGARTRGGLSGGSVEKGWVPKWCLTKATNLNINFHIRD